MGHSFLEVLQDPLTRKLLGFDAEKAEKTHFLQGVTSRLKFLLQDVTKRLPYSKLGYTALEAFLQANCTGPPLAFNPEDVVFPSAYRDQGSDLRQEMIRSLSVDGAAIYALTPHIELFWLAHTIMSNQTLAEEGFNGRRARMRVTLWHQKLLSEKADSLRDMLFADAEILEHQLASRLTFQGAAAKEHFVEFLVERANLRTYYGEDSKAREDLARAALIRQFQFSLTGALGKRTKFQDRDVTQLVVLAKSRDDEPDADSRRSSRAEGDSKTSSFTESHIESSSPATARSPKLSGHPTPSRSRLSGDHKPEALRPLSPRRSGAHPENLSLNDDTLLEQIHFKQPNEAAVTTISDKEHLPSQLAVLDPGEQPLLSPMDSIILLAIASSISNTSPADGLTREETLPYATRVLDGGSSNWQVYTQALLVRSRIEGFRSRTAERGLLQLQALVDQVIVETTTTSTDGGDTRTTSVSQTDGAKTPTTATSQANEVTSTTSFLPKPKPSESASAAERLKYIHQISPPLRWELEAELAQRWTTMGGLKSALDIYERLQMQAEVALCLAAIDREPEAIKLLKGILFDSSSGDVDSTSPEILKTPPPADAPRLLCILGDISSTPEYYTLSWNASSNRYARAQRSLGRHLVKKRDYPAAAEAYTKALNVTRIDLPTWFALGCVQLEVESWTEAVESFTRCVQLEDNDAESWSNLAVALLRLPPTTTLSTATSHPPSPQSNTPDDQNPVDVHRHTFEALRALRRAAHLKREDARIWDNYLTVAASIPPSAGTPWNEIIQAMSQVIKLRSKKLGEGSIDLKILGALVNYITTEFTYPATDVETEDVAETPTTQPDLERPTSSTSVPATVPAADASPTHEPQVETPHPETPLTPQHNIPSHPQPQPPSQPARLPFILRSFLSLLDTLITPLASTPPPYTLLSHISLFRHRPAESLSYAEKAWRATTSAPSVYDTAQGWEAVVDETLRLVGRYRELGMQERERTGGKVEEKWMFKSRSCVRGVLGRGRGKYEGTEGWRRLEEGMEALKS